MVRKSKTNLAIAVVFSIFIVSPIVGMQFPSLDFSYKINEKRLLEESPVFNVVDIENFPEQYESFFNDRFGFREAIIHLNNRIRFSLFGVSSVKKVLVGKDRWLFYTGNEVVDDYRGVNQISLGELEHWRRVLEAKRNWLASQGISYVFVVAPNKHSIYPEYLPNGIRQVRESSPVDQIVKYLAANSDVTFLDLRGTLIERKDEGLLYYPTDTHWTAFGAFMGYEKIIAEVAKDYPLVIPLELADLKYSVKERDGFGLATMLGLQDLLTEDVEYLRVPKRKSFVKKKEGRTLTMMTKSEDLPKAIMFRDSFAMRLIPYLSENFSEIHYITAKWHQRTPIKRMIDEIKPDVVIEEWCERFVKSTGVVSVRF